MNQFEEGIHSALVNIGMATKREIFEFMRDKSLVSERIPSERLIEDYLNRNEINYYPFSNRFIRRRYTFNFVPDIECILPRIFNWDIGRDTLQAECKKTLHEAHIRTFENNEMSFFLVPDNRRLVVFCIESSRYLDGIVDLRRRIHERFRMPSIIYPTMDYPEGATELFIASRIFFDNQIGRYLMIRGTDR